MWAASAGMTTAMTASSWRQCGHRGHVTCAPDDAALADRLSGITGLGQVWRCLLRTGERRSYDQKICSCDQKMWMITINRCVKNGPAQLARSGREIDQPATGSCQL